MRAGAIRDDLNAIGEALVEMAADRKPIPARRVGDLLAKLALVFGRIMNARRLR